MKKDIIKNNRLVSDKTFAIRLQSFMQTVIVSDACTSDEVEYFKSVANSLLSHQLYTVEDTEEIAYLTRLGHLPISATLTTHDGVDIYLRYDPVKLYTCMETPMPDVLPLIMELRSKEDVQKLNPKRMLFWNIEKCREYIQNNCKVYSKEDLRKLGVKI